MSNNVIVAFKLKANEKEFGSKKINEINSVIDRFEQILGSEIKNYSFKKHRFENSNTNHVEIFEFNQAWPLGIISMAAWGRGFKPYPDFYNFYELSISFPESCFRAYAPWNTLQQAQQKTKLFTDIAKTIYNTMHPEFGFGDIDLALEEYEWNLKNCIVWLNFFSKQTVEQIGREKLLTIKNATKIEQLDDGGIFLQLGKTPIGHPTYEEAEGTKKHLGFPKPNYEDIKRKQLERHGNTPDNQRSTEQHITELKKIWEDEK